MGLVLAGGASQRLGRDKATLQGPTGETLAARAVRKLQAVCPDVVLADRGRRLLATIPSLEDGPGAGPAAGILGAAQVYPGRALLVLACDLPEVPEALLAELLREPRADWTVPRWNHRLEPLCALYGPKALSALAAQVAAGNYALHHLAADPTLAIRHLEGETLARFGNPAATFLNVNDAGDLARWLDR